jgi:hypothetical protein
LSSGRRRVQLVVANLQHVSGRRRAELPTEQGKDLAEPGHVHLHGVTGLRRNVFAPKGFDESLD